MNKLCGTRSYLVGAIDRDPTLGKGWRDQIGQWLTEMGVVVFDPLKKPIDIAMEGDCNVKERAEWKKNEEYELMQRHVKDIRRVDLRMVDIVDFLIVNIDITLHACGTYEELMWANRCKKPILIHCEQGKNSAPDWLFGTIPHELIFSSWDEVKDYLSKVNEGADTRHFNRWMFFDLAHPTLFSLLMAASKDDTIKDEIKSWSLNHP